MSALVTAIAFVLIFSVVILAHELGHFVAAKLSGVKVEELGLGYPPRIWGFKRGETIYSINAILLGGFNKLSGEVDPGAERSLASKSIARRLFVLSAGALVNALLPIILFSVAFMVPHDVASDQVVITEIAPHSPAAAAGLVPGDIVLAINSEPIQSFDDISRIVELNLGKEIAVTVQKAPGETVTLHTVPRQNPPEGEGALGIKVGMVLVKKSEPFWRAIPMGFTQTFKTLVLFKDAVLSLFAGTSQLQFTGPVGIAQLTGEAAQAGVSFLFLFAGFLSLNVAIFNLLPLPALDGGRIFFVVLEWVRRGKRISPRLEATVHTIGFILLIALAIAITYQDIVRIIQGGSLTP